MFGAFRQTPFNVFVDDIFQNCWGNTRAPEVEPDIDIRINGRSVNNRRRKVDLIQYMKAVAEDVEFTDLITCKSLMKI